MRSAQIGYDQKKGYMPVSVKDGLEVSEYRAWLWARRLYCVRCHALIRSGHLTCWDCVERDDRNLEKKIKARTEMEVKAYIRAREAEIEAYEANKKARKAAQAAKERTIGAVRP